MIFTSNNVNSKGKSKYGDYNVTDEVTLTGSVKSIVNERRKPVVLTLTTENDEEITIQLSPSWFYNKQKVKLSNNDQVAVAASKCSLTDYMIARSITKGNDTIEFRNKSGEPIWRILKSKMKAKGMKKGKKGRKGKKGKRVKR